MTPDSGFLMKILFLIAFLVPATLLGQIDLKKGLISYYPIEGNLNDESGFRNNAAAKNIIYTTDRFGKSSSAGYFNGVNAFAALPQNSRLNFRKNSSFSISVWVSPDPGNKWPAQAIIVKSPPHYDFTQSFWDYGIYLLNYRGMAGYGYNHILNSETVFNSKTCWYNIIVTYAAGNWKMYINGKEESNSGYQQTIFYDPESVLVLGRKGASDGDYYKGKMDDIRIYNRILKPDEISYLSANPCNKPSCPEEEVPARFSYSISNCSTVSFRLQSGNHPSLTGINWLFGDGKKSSVKSPSHTYKSGEYSIKAITTSKSGCKDTFSKKINIQRLKAGFTYTEEDSPGIILFKANSNGPRYSWDLGDSTIIRNESVLRHTYNQSGEYSIKMMAENNTGCKDTSILKLLVLIPEKKDSINREIVNSNASNNIDSFSFLEKREIEITGSINIESDSIQIALYDNGIIDGDSISLIYDGHIIINKRLLQAQPLNIKLAVPTGKSSHTLQMFAENLGTIPPNTALMIIWDGDKKYEVNISSTSTTNGAIQFRRN